MNIRLIHGVLALAVAGTARGGEVLDQEFDGGALTLGSVIRPDIDKAQTFTVGAVCNVLGSCPILCRVEVLIYSEFLDSGALLFDVRATTANGVPLHDDGQVLASVTVPVGDLPIGSPAIFFSFDVSDFEIAVQAGDVLAIVLRSTATGAGSVVWRGAPFDPYADGTHYVRNPGAGIPTWTGLNADTGFRTYVLQPCTWDCGGDNDGIVGIVDFLALLAQWGIPGDCDFDGGGVGITDFLALLANWGPCP